MSMTESRHSCSFSILKNCNCAQHLCLEVCYANIIATLGECQQIITSAPHFVLFYLAGSVSPLLSEKEVGQFLIVTKDMG